jgi:hypothetical protein
MCNRRKETHGEGKMVEKETTNPSTAPDAILKGCDHSAQGCEERATLGLCGVDEAVNPARVASASSAGSTAGAGR